MHTQRRGFTLMEMLLVVMIGSVLLAMGTREFNSVSNQRAVANAANAMVLTASQARSEALRTGRLVYMWVRPDSGLVRVATASQGIALLDADDYASQITGSSLAVCYAARGYALPGCTNVTSSQTITFVRGRDSSTVVVMPLGQVRRIR